MIKAVKIMTLTVAGLLLSTSIASASIFSTTRMNPCLFTLKNLQNHGYVDDKTYTADEIHNMLKRSAVMARNVDTLISGQSYHVAYSCYIDHQLARINLQATPIDSTSAAVTTLMWEASN